MAVFGNITPPPIPKRELFIPQEEGALELVSTYIDCRRHYGRTVLAEGAPHGARPSLYPTGGRGHSRLLSIHHTASGPPHYDDDETVQVGDFHFERRPLPQDVNVPAGFERESSGMIAPERPPTFGVRYEGQHPDDTQEEHLVRMSEERWKFGFLLSAIAVLVFNLVVFGFSVKEVEIGFPIGFIPVPFLIWTLTMKNKKSTQLDKMKREREDQELDSLLGRDRPRSLGTVTVTR